MSARERRSGMVRQPASTRATSSSATAVSQFRPGPQSCHSGSVSPFRAPCGATTMTGRPRAAASAARRRTRAAAKPVPSSGRPCRR